MASKLQSVRLTQLTSLEREALGAFSTEVLNRLGEHVRAITIHGLHGGGFKISRDMNLMVLLKKQVPGLDEQIRDMALDQFIETGVLLHVACLTEEEFNGFAASRLPALEALTQDALALWAA